MFKALITMVLAGMITASAACAETTVFQISVVIPPMAFHNQNMQMPLTDKEGMAQQRDLPKNIQEQTVVRNKKEVVLSSAVVL